MSGIDKQIYKAEAINLSDSDILRITDNKCNILRYEELENITNIDQILQPYGAAVILYQLEEGYGHWCALIKHSETNLEFFGSYGLQIDEQLKYAKYNLRRHNGIITPHLSHLIENSNYSVTSNTAKLQKFKQDVSTCGRWCSARIRFRDVPIKRFIELFTQNEHYDGDFWVSAMTLLI
jgi:hypothetical protein